ncbi:MAG: type IV toxin-antitoxin system AbiEi family antitoxin domain-containing protein [Mycobacterium sp.]|nr:type IV toxin-antitoxin system AbiEi family antitoxin domain-containing protein [Mycobacterium sp.]
MNTDLEALFDSQHGVATSAQIMRHISRRAFDWHLKTGVLERIWQGIYSRGEPDDWIRLCGLDLAAGKPVPVCLGTAASLYGFDTENPKDLHVLNPGGSHLRHADGLVVHRRDGAPMTVARGRPATAPAWTAVEVARCLRRPRVLATLDAALRSRSCDRVGLARAVAKQAGRRGIVAVRELLPFADPRAESPMESEARLVMINGGLPTPELQYEVIDGHGQLRRLDFAWPQYKVAAEYDGLDWHSGADAMLADRGRTAALMDVGWTVVSIVFEDVRYRPNDLVARINGQFRRARAA